MKEIICIKICLFFYVFTSYLLLDKAKYLKSHWPKRKSSIQESQIPSKIEKIGIIEYIMEEILCRFQHLGEQIFAELDDLSLAKSRETSRSWLNFICNEKFYKNRITEMLANKATDYGKLRGELLRSKVHCAAFYGQTQIVMDILENSSEKSPANDNVR